MSALSATEVGGGGGVLVSACMLQLYSYVCQVLCGLIVRLGRRVISSGHISYPVSTNFAPPKGLKLKGHCRRK